MKKNNQAPHEDYIEDVEVTPARAKPAKAKKKRSRLPLYLLLCVIGIVFLVSAFKLGSMLWDYAVARKQYSDLSNNYTTIVGSSSGSLSAGANGATGADSSSAGTAGYLMVDQNGNVVDANGNPVAGASGYLTVDRNGNVVDANGNPVAGTSGYLTVDRNGNVVDANGNPIAGTSGSLTGARPGNSAGVPSTGATAENIVPNIYFAPPEGALNVTYTETSPIVVDFKSLCARCKDVIGWIYSPDTIINYPVVIGEDNAEYLHKGIDGSYIYAGTIFADFSCSSTFSDANTILYGHNMNDGSMFAKIMSYRTQEYYDAHPVMYLNTPSQNYRVDIFTAYTTPDNSDTYTFRFTDEKSYQAYLTEVAAKSDIRTRVTPDTAHRIITLSTCAYDYENARYVVQGVLVPIG